MSGDEEADELAPEGGDYPLAGVGEHGRERVRLVRAESRIAHAKLTRVDVSVEEEIIAEGYPSLAAFFAMALAMPRSIESFIYFVEMFHFDPALSSEFVVKVALQRLMRIAIEANLPFIRGKAYVDPLAAAKWIDSLPSERGLLPQELRDFLRAGAKPAQKKRSGG